MRYEVVGWILTDDVQCDGCDKLATCYISRDGVRVEAVCNDCLPRDTKDPIAEIFLRALKEVPPGEPT